MVLVIGVLYIMLFDEHEINKVYGFVDADYVGDRENRRNRLGFVIMMNLGNVLGEQITTVVAISTTDAGVYATITVIEEVI